MVAKGETWVAERIREFNAGRDPQRLALKHRIMRASVFAFLRGTCHLFYERLPAASLFRGAPLAWICGDLHLENFGSYKGDNRLVYFDLNDFDEAALAPCTWELVRIVTSILVGGESIGLDKGQARTLSRRFLDGYVAAIEDGKSRWVERETAQGMVRKLLDSLRLRKRQEFLDSRTVRVRGRRKMRLDGKRTLPVTVKQRERIKRFMRKFAKQQPNPKFYRLLDVARRIAGTGSLGVERYALLIEGKGSPNGNYLLDLKQALPSSLAPFLRWKQPKWQNEAQRVVTAQRRVQAVPMAFLGPVVIDGTPFVLKGLQPVQDRVALDKWRGDLALLEQTLLTMAHLTAWGELRSSGLQGSATADELIEYWGKPSRREKLLALALDCRRQTQRDWRDYCEAFDRGAFPEAGPARRGAKRKGAAKSLRRD
jgi:uncharacterized protein (DUF2252 family)